MGDHDIGFVPAHFWFSIGGANERGIFNVRDWLANSGII
jgi:hypothetical protein